MSMTSHSKTLSPTSPQEMPGRSLASCIYFSCRFRRPAAAEVGCEGVDLLDMLKTVEEGVM
jgi:hypothetical protein